ncbi:MAG: tyrosine-type recombinase/integrase, partial [Gammaproteobacteria bacterium]
AWSTLLERAGITDLRMHDLRRTFGSWQAALGSSSLIIGKSLGHRDPTSTAIYARLNVDPVRASVERATDAMLATATEGTP